MSEKTEKASAYKLQKAKEKGQVSKSSELSINLSLLIMLAIIAALWPKTLMEVQSLMQGILNSASNSHLNLDTINQLNKLILYKLTHSWLVFALGMTLAVIITTIAQTGFIWSSTPLIPDWKRLSFTTGFKKIFSIRTCFEAGKMSLKLCFLPVFLYWIIKSKLGLILSLCMKTPDLALRQIMHWVIQSGAYLLVILIAFALIDKLFTHWKFNKDQRMSKQEVKEEHKLRDGDPKIKAKIRLLQYQLRQKMASLKQVHKADVLILNPSHIAIALQYDQLVMPAPKVLCKAQGHMVKLVKRIARKHHIPLIENKIFARALYKSTGLNQCISSELYPMAAGIFKEIYKQRNAYETDALI